MYFFPCCFCINLFRTCAFSICHFDWYRLFDKTHSIPSLLPTQMKVNQKRAYDTLYPLWWGELEEQVQTELEPAHHNLRDYITRRVRAWEKSKILPTKKVKKRRLAEMVPIQAHTLSHTHKHIHARSTRCNSNVYFEYKIQTKQNTCKQWLEGNGENPKYVFLSTLNGGREWDGGRGEWFYMCRIEHRIHFMWGCVIGNRIKAFRNPSDYTTSRNAPSNTRKWILRETGYILECGNKC